MKENFKKESPILSLPSLGGGANAPSVAGGGGGGQDEYTSHGTYTWTCPAGVTSVSVVCVGAGGTMAMGSYGTGGGSLAYKNNITVTPGQNYTIIVGQTNTSSNVQYANNSSAFGTVAYGGYTGAHTFYNQSQGIGQNYDGGGQGGIGTTDYYSGTTGYQSGSGGGAGGYSGNGGTGANGTTAGGNGSGGGGGGGGHAQNPSKAAGGGGVGLQGEGSSGAGGLWSSTPADTVGHGGSGGTDSDQVDTTSLYAYGGEYGGGSGQINSFSSANFSKQSGAVRIIYPGTDRQFPSTRTADE